MSSFLSYGSILDFIVSKTFWWKIMAIDKEKFVKNLREFRNWRRVSLRTMAEDIGCSYGSINKYEKNETEPSFEMLNKLAAYFGVSVATLLGEDQSTDLKCYGYGMMTAAENKPTSKFVPLVNVQQAANLDDAFKSPSLDQVPVETTVKGDFALKMEGNSMDPDIKAGDTLIISTEQNAVSGNYVVARIEGDNSVMIRKYREKYNDDGSSYCELIPSNSDYAPFNSHQRKIYIIGVVTARIAYFS
jgi:SOS-response transcriptional repressor LexA